MKNHCFIRLILLIIISFNFVSEGRSQNWCPPGATWHFGLWGPSSYGGYEKIEYVSDTVINSKNCQVLSVYSVAYFAPGPSSGYGADLFTYSEGGVSYLYNDDFGIGKFDTLFNINASVGDSWRMPFADTCYNDTLNFIKVLDTGTKIINGNNLKWLYVTFDPGSLGTSPKYDTIIERIGFTYGPFYYYTFCGMIEEGYANFRCYSDFTFAVYPDSAVDCDYPLAVKDHGDNNFSNVFPNPNNGNFSIRHSIDDPDTEFVIYDVTGKLITKDQIPVGDEIVIREEWLENGIYIWHLIDKNGIKGNGKIIIMK